MGRETYIWSGRNIPCGKRSSTAARVTPPAPCCRFPAPRAVLGREIGSDAGSGVAEGAGGAVGSRVLAVRKPRCRGSVLSGTGMELLGALPPAQAFSRSRANTTRKRAVIFFMIVHSVLGYRLSAMPENYLG